MLPVPGLACPACRSDLRGDGEARLICDACGGTYPVFDGIPSFVAPTLPSPKGEREPQLTVLISSPHPDPPPPGGRRKGDQLLSALRQELGSLAIDHELIVMDTGSTYGWALRRGLEQAAGEYVLTLDADGSHDPSFLAAIWAARHEAEVVIASRYIEA